MEREQAAPGDEGGAGQNLVRWSRTSVAASASASLGLADRAACLVCTRSMPLTKAGPIRIHGPLSNRCTGSGIWLVPQVLDDNCSTEPLTPPIADDSPPELIFSADIHRSTRVLKRIPRAARHLAATKLGSALDDVTNKNDSDSCERLFKFASHCFAQPQRGSQCRSRTSTVKCILKQTRPHLESLDNTVAPIYTTLWNPLRNEFRLN